MPERGKKWQEFHPLTAKIVYCFSIIYGKRDAKLSLKNLLLLKRDGIVAECRIFKILGQKRGKKFRDKNKCKEMEC